MLKVTAHTVKEQEATASCLAQCLGGSVPECKKMNAAKVKGALE